MADYGLIGLKIPYDMNHCKACRIEREPDRLVGGLCVLCVTTLVRRLADNLAARDGVIIYLLSGRTIKRREPFSEEETVAFLAAQGRDATGAPLAEQEGGR